MFFFLTNTANSIEKVVFIDLNFIFKNSIAGKNLDLQIINQTKKLKVEISVYKDEIKLKKKELLSKKNVLADDEYKKKVIILEKRIKEINSIISNKNKNLSIFKSNVEKEFFVKLNSIIEKYSIDNSISIILKKENLLMAKKNLDITNDIFEIFNENIDKITIK